MGVGLGKSILWLAVTAFILPSFLPSPAQAQPEANFKCTTPTPLNATCHALIDYTSPTATTLRAVQRLFTVKHLPDIVGANTNLLPTNASGTYIVPPNSAVRVPFPCKCVNGTGLSNGVPVYKIVAGDTLDGIAREKFGGVVKYQQIQVANKIGDANNITAGDSLWIPLPCSCDPVGGRSVVHYAHVVPTGSTVEGIAAEYGSTKEEILTLNGIADPKTLQAGQVLDVPLRACTSSVKNESLDFPLLVANSTYVYTANQCVKCKCDSGNNYILQCEASNLKPTNRWSVCPSTQCSGNVSLGNVSSSTDSCNRTFCDYAGYDSRKISTTLATDSFCPAPAPAPSGSGSSSPSGSGSLSPSGSGSSSPSGSGASRSNLQGWVLSYLFIATHFILFYVYLL